MNTAIELSDVTVRFGSGDGAKTVLNGLDLSIERGEFVVVVGRSGGGKTTMMNLLAGLLVPNCGKVAMLGQTAAKAQKQVALMLARDALLPWRTARRNVEYGLELRKVPRAERRARAAEYLAQAGLQEAGNQFPWQLSQGMRQRVALARTWALQAEILLMDEPFSAVDAETRESLQEQLLELWALHKRTVVFITHDLNEAVFLADRVIVVGGGGVLADRRVQQGRPRDMASMLRDEQAIELLVELRALISNKNPSTSRI